MTGSSIFVLKAFKLYCAVSGVYSNTTLGDTENTRQRFSLTRKIFVNNNVAVRLTEETAVCLFTFKSGFLQAQLHELV